MRLRQRRDGFTLIELMVVMVLLGVLAALAVGLVGRSRRDAKRVAVQEAANETQQAIALYREYAGRLPNLIAGWDPLTRPTTVNGRPLGPFLSGPPQNPLADGDPSCITDGNAAVLYTGTCSWLYDYGNGNGTGRFIGSYEPAP